MKIALLCSAVAVTAAATVTKPEAKLPSELPRRFATVEQLFENQCARCHGPHEEGGSGPVLAQARLARASDDGALIKVLENGICGTEMFGANSMPEREVRQVAGYVRTLARCR